MYVRSLPQPLASSSIKGNLGEVPHVYLDKLTLGGHVTVHTTGHRCRFCGGWSVGKVLFVLPRGKKNNCTPKTLVL